MTAYVLVVRHPDRGTEITSSGDVEVVEIDLGAGFDGRPSSEEEALDWLGGIGPTYLDPLPVTGQVYASAMSVLEMTLSEYPKALAVLHAYEARRVEAERRGL